MRALFLTSLLLSLPGVALAVDVNPLPPDGGFSSTPRLTNMTEEWKNSGAARLYWDALVIPRQLQQGGASFKDPASVPELPLARPETRKARTSGKKSTAVKGRQPSLTQTSAQPAPAGAGSTALKTPDPSQDKKLSTKTETGPKIKAGPSGSIAGNANSAATDPAGNASIVPPTQQKSVSPDGGPFVPPIAPLTHNLPSAPIPNTTANAPLPSVNPQAPNFQPK
ncbi:MAG: hypothetical protein LBR31_04325 [Desulfovibrio sp.]|nr:hypothetical protein [Desulfovibrio sp.]